MLKNSFTCDLSVVWKRPNLSDLLLNFHEEPKSTPMHYSAGGFGVLKVPTFQCSQPLGDLMHASPYPVKLGEPKNEIPLWGANTLPSAVSGSLPSNVAKVDGGPT